jgi:hypothetical protein
MSLYLAPRAAACLVALRAAASSKAQRVSSAAAPAEAAPDAERLSPLRLIGTAALCAASTGVALAAAWYLQAADTVPDLDRAAALRLREAMSANISGAAKRARTAAAQDVVVQESAAAPASVPSRIERSGDGLLTLHLVAHDRADAARRLAALTQAKLLDRPEALSAAPALTLRWQGRDAAAAWRALLGDDAHYALHCRDAAACTVWIFGAHVGTAASATASASAPGAPGPKAFAADAAVAAVPASAAAEMQALQPDPPGLFPSD